MAVLAPQIKPDLARRLLEQFGAEPAYLGQVIVDYHNQLYREMLHAPDDRLVGYRGMMLALDYLAEALQRDKLQALAERRDKRT